MQKIKIIVDSPCDIPDDDLTRYDIEMVGVPIYVDGKGYVERESFSCQEFYPILEHAHDLPTTSRVPIGVLAEKYRKNWDEGCTDIIVITMNAGGSSTYESAQMAAKLFFSDTPEAVGTLSIHIVDSMTYSMGYGYPAVRAAAMIQEGNSTEEILEYLSDIFSRIEILLVCYTLEYAKRSGRITAAAAVVGDMLSVRPIIAMIGGTTEITSKVRGNKNAIQKLLDTYHERRVSPDEHVLTASAAIDEYGQELKKQLEQELGRDIPHYKIGAAITINAGPRMAALCYLGCKRERDESKQPSVITYNGITGSEMAKKQVCLAHDCSNEIA